MNKFIRAIYLIFTLLILMNLAIGNKPTMADWWSRSGERPTQPSTPREELFPTQPIPISPPPTAVPTSRPTNASTNVPTLVPTNSLSTTIGPTPTNSPTGGTPSTGGDNGLTGNNGSACDPGKPFTGPYCGWSPSTSGKSGGNVQGQPRIGGPQVLGLSDTSSGDLALSDIILLAGILCLALYARSKLEIKTL